MSFVAILLALLIEQARPVSTSNPIHTLLRTWVRWASASFDAGRRHHAQVAWFAAAGLPAALVAAADWLLDFWAGWPLVVVWHVCILYLCLGFRQFSHHFTAIRDALASGDDDQARLLLARWRRVDPAEIDRSQVVRRLIEHSVIAAHRHVFGVIGWYGVLAALGLGPAGAVLYRLAEFVPRYWRDESLALAQPVSEALRDLSARLWWLIDWLPARMTAIGFAIVGSFEEAIQQWRGHGDDPHDDGDAVILRATAGAINLRVGPGYPGGDPSGDASSAQLPQPAHLQVVVGLVWRTVLLWMVLLALLTLARLLG